VSYQSELAVDYRGLVQRTDDTCLPVDGVYNILVHSVHESHANAACNRLKVIIAAEISNCLLQLTHDRRPASHELHPELGQSHIAAAGRLVQANLQNRRPC